MLAHAIPDADPRAVALDHDYGDDATILANFLTGPDVTLRQQAAITLLCMAAESPRARPVVDEDAVDVCAAAIFDVTRAAESGGVRHARAPGVPRVRPAPARRPARACRAARAAGDWRGGGGGA